MQSPARQRLTQALARRATAQAAIAPAEQVCAAGEAFVDQAKAALRAIGVREAASGAETAQAIKAAIKEGRSPPRAAALEGGAARATAQAEVAAREAALKLLAAELAEVHQAAAAASQEVKLAVRAVLVEDALAAAHDGVHALDALTRAYRRARSAERAGYLPGVGPLSLPDSVVAFLRHCSEPDDPVPQHEAAMEQWHDYRAALELDADAGPPSGELPTRALRSPTLGDAA